MKIKISPDGMEKSDSEFKQEDSSHRKKDEEDTAAISTGIKVELSTRSLNIKEMRAKAMSFPDVRTEKVEQIKMQIDSGTYRISHEKIAEQLIEEAIEQGPSGR